MSDQKLEIKNLVKRYGSVTAVDHIDLSIGQGKLFSFLGPSGCGKTTTLRMIAGLETPTEGEIVVDGEVLSDSKRVVLPEKRNMGMVFQSYAVWPHMTVSDNVAYGLKIKKQPRSDIEKKVRETLSLVGLADYQDRYPTQLSGGQQQRVALARAIVIHPSVLLMDEPLSNLDAKLRIEMRNAIKMIQNDVGITTIYVTHDQEEAMAVSDRIAVMNAGVIQHVGTPKNIYQRPANLFVAGFIGSPQMNFFENCQLTKTADSYTLTVMDETVTLTAEQSAKLAAAGVESRSVTAGVRPVHISLGESGIPAEVDVSELMGSELHLHLAANGQDVVAVIPTANIDPGAYARHTAVKFGFDAKLVHLFDSDSEKNLI